MRTLIVFAKAPVIGRVKTRLAASVGRAAALELYRAMLADLAAVLRHGFPGRVVWYVDGDRGLLEDAAGPLGEVRPQVGGDLGERMRNAFADCFKECAGPVGIIGTDCPALGLLVLEELFGVVEERGGAAVAPSTDGGYAALVMDKREDRVFAGVPWSSPDTLSETRKAFGRVGIALAELPPLTDLDDGKDLAGIIGSGVFGPSFGRTLLEFAWTGTPLATVIDDLGRVVEVTPHPGRIVSLVPSVTEALHDLGAGSLVVGRTDYCISPRPWVESIESVGGPKTFDPAQVLALKPDLVFADAEENDRCRVEELISKGVRVFVALPRDLTDVAAFLRRTGSLIGEAGAGEAAASRLEGFEPVANPVRSLLLIWNEPVMAAGPGTLPGALALAAGFSCEAPTGCETGYPVVGDGELAGIAVNSLLLPSEPHAFSLDESVTLLKKTGAAQAILFPGEWATWYGVRTINNLNNLATLPERAQGVGVFDFR